MLPGADYGSLSTCPGPSSRPTTDHVGWAGQQTPSAGPVRKPEPRTVSSLVDRGSSVNSKLIFYYLLGQGSLYLSPIHPHSFHPHPDHQICGPWCGDREEARPSCCPGHPWPAAATTQGGAPTCPVPMAKCCVELWFELCHTSATLAQRCHEPASRYSGE